MDSNCIFHDGKTETGAPEFARTAFVDAVKALEKVLQMLRLYTRAIVSHQKLIEMAAFCLNLATRDLQTRCPDSIGDGIVYKVTEDAVYQALVAQHFHMLRHLK